MGNESVSMAQGTLYTDMTFSTPILFITYRRYDTALKVFHSIAGVQPTKLYFASNAAKTDTLEDMEQILRVRSLITNIDWPCQVFCRYPLTYLNVQQSIHHALTWFFHYEDEGIILEDDCVPLQDFFFYSQDLLRKYRDDPRVWAISGNSFIGEATTLSYSYYFSKYFHCWGWATWRRTWSRFDLSMASFPSFFKHSVKYPLFDSVIERAYWIYVWTRIYKYGIPLTWDYQFFYHIFSNGGLVIQPRTNLVANIGFSRADAENTRDGGSPLPKPASLLPIRHPIHVLRNIEADRIDFHVSCLKNSTISMPVLFALGLLIQFPWLWYRFQSLALLFGKRI